MITGLLRMEQGTGVEPATAPTKKPRILTVFELYLAF